MEGVRAVSTLAPARSFLSLVKIEHSVFALPFAYLSALTAMARGPHRVTWGDLLLITVAMVGARTFAMAANRIIDRHIDARTALLNPLCLALSPLAVLPLIVYPYAKRFTNWPHGILALAQMVGPVGAWLAVTGTVRGSFPAWVLGAAVGLWIGGFDLIYATQDVEVDREIGVHSVPARYGVRFALVASAVAHVVTFGLFVWYGVLVGLGAWWWAGLLVTAVAFGYEHAIVRPGDLSRVNRAFFTANGFVGIALFAFALADLIGRL
ncbi:MAG: 4-hydroxybenzoate polyprenyltransferase [Actinobacteria bacterium 13_1_20CM_3_71_11]|nr:MAG: 4-hydroxybenzoate polyprenyltransferase [Actinobacteria bacterium 13_1_20CM_3_71_11]